MVSEAHQLALQMERAEQRGDRRTARALASSILATSAEAETEAEGAARASAAEVLLRTEPDPFLLVVGMLGLGLMVWLVYNYVL